MTPITTQTDEQQHPEEIEMQQMQTEDETRRLSPLTQSASSTLRDDLARFQEQEWRRYHEAISRNREALGRTLIQHAPPYGDRYYQWQPPMAPPPTPPQPTEPPPSLPTSHRRRMNMRVNLPPPEDEPPRKLSRQNSKTDKGEGSSTAETDTHTRCCATTRRAHDQDTEVQAATPPNPQQSQRNEAAEQTNQDNIPELFKTIANRKI